MKVLYLDLETTGLDCNVDQIIEIGAVFDDLKNPRPLNMLPYFHSYVKHERVLYLDMHKLYYETILPKLGDQHRCQQVQESFLQFMRTLGLPKDEKGVVKVNVGGKNVAGFDYQFLKQWLYFRMDGSALRMDEFKFGQRIVDPAMLFFDPSVDEKLPDTNLCTLRAGFHEQTKHDALGDCFMVLKCIRSFYRIS